MKRLFISLFILTISFSQDTTHVSWTGTPGELEAAITGPGVYSLDAGRVYLTLDHIPVEYGAIHIVGVDPGDEHPATIQPALNWEALLVHTNNELFTLIGDDAELVLKGLILNGTPSDYESNMSNLHAFASARGARNKIVVDDCVVDGVKHLAFFTMGTQTDFHFTNSVAKAFTNGPNGMFYGGLFWGGGSWMGTIDTLVVQNNTISGVIGEALVIYEHVDYGLVDHNTFANINMGVVWYRGQNNLTVKNNLFYNTKSYGQSTYDINNWGVWQPGGHGQMSIMPSYEDPYEMEQDGQFVDMDNRNIKYHNNVWYHDLYLIDYMQTGPWSWTYDNVTYYDTMLSVEDQSKWLDDSTIVALEQGVGITEYGNTNSNPFIALDPNYTMVQIQRNLDLREDHHSSTFPFDTPFWTYQHDNDYAVVEWPMHIDLSYDHSTPAGSASESGGPVGDPRWGSTTYECGDGTYDLQTVPDNITLIDGNRCLSLDDLSVLQALIDENDLTEESSDNDLDNGDGALTVFELGLQEWVGGRLQYLDLWGIANYENFDESLKFEYGIQTIPNNIGLMQELIYLDLDNNELSSLPDEFGDLSSLEVLFLGQGNLFTEFPSPVLELTNLYRLYLYDTQITSIPSEINNLYNLERLYLDRNEITGPIPSSMWDLTNLQRLYLGENQIDGTISSLISRMTNLERLGLWDNAIEGTIPTELWSLPVLSFLDLTDNQLSGELSPSVANLENLVSLYLGHNQLTGEIPNEIGQLTNLRYLNLMDNQFVGGIPNDLVNLYNLEFLELSDNPLGGEIPEGLTEMSSLESLYLYNNQLTGLIPAVICDMEGLSFGFGDNFLCPPYPSCLSEEDILSQNTDDCLIPEPVIQSINDVPGDQGGQVYISFNASSYDGYDYGSQEYGIMRLDQIEDDAYAWVMVASGPAIEEEHYIFLAPTRSDSTSEDDGLTAFKVVASMDAGVFHSEPMMGYSIDNIAPGIPEGVMALAVDEYIQVTWNQSRDEDFQYFIVEKSGSEDFSEYQSFMTIDTSYADLEYTMEESNYYRIAAVDYAGNISEYSDIVHAVVLEVEVEAVPNIFVIHQNFPNPFNPVTLIKYDLPEDAMVTIIVYDVMGRKVKTLVNNDHNVGYHSIEWDATNDLNQPVGAGMYFYTIQADKFLQTKKMVLIK